MAANTHASSQPNTATGPGVWIAVFLLGVVVLLNLYTTQPILGHIADWAGVSTAAAAWTISATTFGVAMVAPIAGAISDHLGRKRIILYTLALMIVATVLCSLSPPFPLLLVLRAIQGIGIPFVSAVTVAYMAEEFPAQIAVRINTVYLAGAAFGGFSGRFFSGLLVSVSDHWQLVFIPITVLLILTILATMSWLPKEQHFKPSASVRDGLTGLPHVIRQPELLGVCFVGAGLLFLQVTSFTYGSLELQEPPFSLSTFRVSLIFLVFLVPMITTPMFGMVMGRIGEVRCYWIAATIGILGLELTALESTPLFVVGLALWVIAVFGGQASCTRYTARYFTHNRSAAVGCYLTAFYLGGTIGGVAPAPLYESYGWHATLVLLIGIAIATAVVATLTWRD